MIYQKGINPFLTAISFVERNMFWGFGNDGPRERERDSKEINISLDN